MTDGWWRLNIEGTKLNDADRQHIAEMIEEGYEEGEICHEEEDDEEPEIQSRGMIR
jgi:hypothetical protein